MARGDRLIELQRHGLILEDAERGRRTVLPVAVVEGVTAEDRYDIPQQKTMLGEPDGRTSSRLRNLSDVIGQAGFPTTISRNVPGWLNAHTAFVVPIASALYRFETDAVRLAADRSTLLQMVRATQQAFRALQAAGDAEIPTNLRWLYLRMPERFAVSYWRRALAGPRGELWFAAHSRAAPDEMASLAVELLAAFHRSKRPSPDLDALVTVER